MARILLLCALATVLLQNTIALASGPQVYSIGSLTASLSKRHLKDEDFAADLSAASDATGGNEAQVERADVAQHPVLGLSDVQSGVERVFLRNGAIMASHLHPRASETLYVESGLLLTSLRFEGFANARVVRLTLSRGHVTVFPQGLPHTIKCASAAGCNYVTFYNSADAGVVAAPAFI